jgi:hypothetical protein
MPIYEIAADSMRRIKETSFSAAGVRERGDLQRLLRGPIDIISLDTLVISKEFGRWEDGRRRIDLLGLDRDANLVVIELKRTDDGGHMELQAVRYAAMVSAMTFDEVVVEVYAAHLRSAGGEADARSAILEFLDWEEPDEDRFAQDVRIVLVSAEFSKELTTAVMWLNERGLDVRCVRMKPYADNGRVLVDVQQVIPLPEAADYIVKIKEKEVRERTARKRQSVTAEAMQRFWTGLLQHARTRTDLHAGVSPADGSWVGTSAGRGGINLNYVAGRKSPRVEIYIYASDQATSKKGFDQLFAAKAGIEKAFGGPLGWERLDAKRGCRVKAELSEMSIRNNEAEWPSVYRDMVETMIRFERALRPHLDALDLSA